MEPDTRNNADIQAHFTENWDKVIELWLEGNLDKMLARQIFPIRTIGADKEVDVVQEYTRKGRGAIIAAKGQIPDGSGAEAGTSEWKVHQLLDGFNIHRRDLNLDPKVKDRDMRITMRNIHRLEDELGLLGVTTPEAGTILGMVYYAQQNPNGKGVAAGATGNDFDNAGAWSGSSLDPYADILNGTIRLDPRFEPFGIAGHRYDLAFLDKMDSQRKKFSKDIAPLFGKGENDMSWRFPFDKFPRGKVYILTRDELGAEMVVSENPTYEVLPQQRGGVFPTELYAWEGYEFHKGDGGKKNMSFVEIDIT